jgi:hypothetical protein
MADCVNRGRSAKGIKNGKGKLTDAQVSAIRIDTGRGVDIAARYGISEAMVSMIRSGERRFPLSRET